MRAFEIGQQSCLIEKAIGAPYCVALPVTVGAGAETQDRASSSNESQAGALGISTCHSGLRRPDWRVIISPGGMIGSVAVPTY